MTRFISSNEMGERGRERESDRDREKYQIGFFMNWIFFWYAFYGLWDVVGVWCWSGKYSNFYDGKMEFPWHPKHTEKNVLNLILINVFLPFPTQIQSNKKDHHQFRSLLRTKCYYLDIHTSAWFDEKRLRVGDN